VRGYRRTKTWRSRGKNRSSTQTRVHVHRSHSRSNEVKFKSGDEAYNKNSIIPSCSSHTTYSALTRMWIIHKTYTSQSKTQITITELLAQYSNNIYNKMKQNTSSLFVTWNAVKTMAKLTLTECFISDTILLNTGRFWIDGRIYLDLWHNAWLHFTVHCYTHIYLCPQPRLHCCCLVAASNRGRSPSSGSFLGPSPAGLVTIFYCLRFETPSTWRVRSPYLYPPGTGWHSYTPGHCGPYSSPPSSSQRQSYFTTGGLPPIISSWRRAPWDSRPDFVFSIEHLRS
jgi:hypothetical protein